MLSIGLTGGIAAGKSLIAARLSELGAVLIDADQLARQVVAPGSKVLEKIVAEFGPQILTPEGSLDRSALGALIFGDGQARARLNAIVHPKVQAAAAKLRSAAPADAIVVEDIPLLVETGQQDRFHCVLVVDAPLDLRVARLVEHRGLSEAEAWQRIRAQASEPERLAAADVVVRNDASARCALDLVSRLWAERLLPFACNLVTGQPAPRLGRSRLSPYQEQWPQQARRLLARLRYAMTKSGQADGVGFDHIGSTSVPGLPAQDVIDLQLRLPSLNLATAIEPVLMAAGFPGVPGIGVDDRHVSVSGSMQWRTLCHVNADPGRAVNLYIREQGSADAECAVAFRDWLRAEPAVRQDYLTEKQSLAKKFDEDLGAAGYRKAKELWFNAAEPRLRAWRDRSGWLWSECGDV